jgi:HlyD family secretion protein
LSALKSDIDYQRDSIQNAQESLSINKNAWDTAQVDNDTRLISAKDGLAQAEAARDSAVASAEASLASAEAGVASAQAELARAQAQYDDTTAPPRGVDVAALIAAVSQARANLAAASVRLGNTQVVSPIDGIVTEIAFDPGEQVVGGTAVVTVQTADENQFKIVVDVPEADIAKIAYGDAADLTFDAFGDDVHVAGSVADIDPAEKTVEGVVFYEVSIYLDTSSLDLPLKPGMSAEVTITTDTRTGVLFVPQRAVLEHDDGTKYVRIPRDDVFDERAVETGLRADDGKLEILSGVSEGEVIVLSLHSK